MFSTFSCIFHLLVLAKCSLYFKALVRYDIPRVFGITSLDLIHVEDAGVDENSEEEDVDRLSILFPPTVPHTTCLRFLLILQTRPPFVSRLLTVMSVRDLSILSDFFMVDCVHMEFQTFFNNHLSYTNCSNFMVYPIPIRFNFFNGSVIHFGLRTPESWTFLITQGIPIFVTFGIVSRINAGPQSLPVAPQRHHAVAYVGTQVFINDYKPMSYELLPWCHVVAHPCTKLVCLPDLRNISSRVPFELWQGVPDTTFESIFVTANRHMHRRLNGIGEAVRLPRL